MGTKTLTRADLTEAVFAAVGLPRNEASQLVEDILEEVIGDIKDEFDEEESGNKKLDENTYIFEGSTMLHDACRLMNLPEDTFDQVKGESDSMAGLILEQAGEIPAVNDVVTIGDFEFTILEVDRNRIKKVKVTIKQQAL